MSSRTKKLSKLKNIFLVCSLLLWIGTSAALIFITLSKITSHTNPDEIEKTISITIGTGVKSALASLSVTALIGIVASIIIKDKVRTFTYMIDVVVAALLFNRTGMIVVLIIWFIDEYIFFMLYKHYKLKQSINKEIDLRE